MYRTICTAVAAIAAQRVRSQAVRAMSAVGIDLLCMTDNASDARRAAALLRPDLFIADRELPGMEGASLVQWFLSSHALPVRPASIILRYPEFPAVNDDRLALLGSVFVNKPVCQSDFAQAVDQLRSSAPVFPAEEVCLTDELLNALGVPPHIGRKCLQTAVLLCAADERYLQNFSSRLYPLVGKMHCLNPFQAERAMRHAIGRAWQSDKFENQYRIFADTVDAGRGQPTPREMISRLADILRLEG